MNDAEFLDWLADRLIYVYGEGPNVSYVHRLRDMSKQIKENEKYLDNPRPILFNNAWFKSNKDER